jgi:hypothetical protein|tara:strand:+ start:115 stop:558 length:444 start_codon:yes stop_codon:yes gene_type:complete
MVKKIPKDEKSKIRKLYKKLGTITAVSKIYNVSAETMGKYMAENGIEKLPPQSPEEKKKYMDEWNAENADHLKEYRRQYYKEYRKNNKDKMLKYGREYRKDHLEEMRKSSREYHEKNKDTLIPKIVEYNRKRREGMSRLDRMHGSRK